MPNTAPDGPALLTADELAAHLRVHVETVRRWRREGRIPSLGSGKSQRYELAAVKAALASPVPGASTDTAQAVSS